MEKSAAPDYRRRRRIVLALLVLIGTAFGALLLNLGPMNLIWPKVLWSMGHHEDALDSVERVQPATTDSRLLRARLLFANDKFVECSQAFLEVGPETTEDLVLLGRALAKQGRWSESIPILEGVADEEQLPPVAFRDLADGYAYLGDYDKAAEYIEILSQLGDRAHALYRLGLLDRELNRPEAFVRNWSELVEIADDSSDLPKTLDELKVILATVCLELVMIDEAEKAIEGASESAGQQDILADLAAYRGDRATAQKYWRSALDLNPELPETREALARSLLEESEFAEALAVLTPLEKNRIAWTTDVCMAFQLAYAGTGDKENADVWLERREQAQHELDEVRELMLVASKTGSPMARAIRAWKLASTGNRQQASLIIGAMESQLSENTKETRLGRYVQLLAAAIRKAGELPDPADYLLDRNLTDQNKDSGQEN